MTHPNPPRRHLLRLQGYDYSQPNAYFVTIVIEGRNCILGDVFEGEMHPNDAGRMIEKWWQELSNKFHLIKLDEFGIMPNHFHGLLWRVGADLRVGPGLRASPNPDQLVGADLRVGPGLRASPDPDQLVGADLRVGPGLHAGPDPDQIVGADLRVGPGLHASPDPEGRNEKNENVSVSLPSIMQWFKTMTTNAYIRGVRQNGWPPFPGKLWQRNYYDHIVRDDKDLDNIRRYIKGNPILWEEDNENPKRANVRS